MPSVAEDISTQPKIRRVCKKSKEMEMDDPLSVVPCYDPYYDCPVSDQIFMFDENSSLRHPELPSMGEPSSCSAFVSESEVGFGDDCGKLRDTDDPLSDQFLWEMINEPIWDTVGNCEGGASGNNAKRVDEGNVANSQISQGLETGNQVQPPVSTVLQTPYSCSFCHILREIIHVNGKHVRDLEIHGRVGVISHAVLDKYDVDSSSEKHEHQMFDFCNESICSVKTFLVQYYEDCRRQGYSMLQDPLSNFYQALCIGYDENVNFACNNFLQSSPVVSGDHQTNQQNLASQQDDESNGIRLSRSDSQQDDESNGMRLSRSDNRTIHSQHEAESKEASSSRSFLATQRERTGKLKLKDFSGYFHLPIHEAAKKMNVCPTVIKKKCRQGGLSRWPYRKIKGIKRKIIKKHEILSTGTVEGRTGVTADVRMLEQELENIFTKFSC